MSTQRQEIEAGVQEEGIRMPHIYVILFVFTALAALARSRTRSLIPRPSTPPTPSWMKSRRAIPAQFLFSAFILFQ